MAYIKSRKHPSARTLGSHTSAATAVGLALASLSAYAVEPATPAAEASLPTVNVQGRRINDYKAETVSSPKFTQPLRDTPQTITVVKKEVLQQQGATTLSESLRNTPGITLQLGENGNTASGDAISMRGFDTQGNIFVDGIRDVGSITRDAFNIEQVEIVKGPSGADFGRGSPTGYINLSSKVPLAEDFSDGAVSVGSADKYRLTADLNRTLNAETGTAVRLNVMGQGGGTAGRDYVKNKSWGVAPSVALGLGTPTRTYLSYFHIEQDNRPDGGVPTIGWPGYYAQALADNGIKARRVDSSNYYGSLADFDDVRADMLTARIEHQISPAMTLRNTTRYGHTKQYRSTTSIVAPNFNVLGDPSTWTVNRNRSDGSNRQSDGGQSKLQTNTIVTNQTNLTSTFVTGTVKHDLSTGLELLYEKQNKKQLQGVSGGTGTNGATIPPANLYNPDPRFPLVSYDPRTNGAFDEGTTKTVALYAFDTLTLSEQWKLNAGLRWERYETDFTSRRVAPPAGQGPASYVEQEDSDNLLSAKIGVVYKPVTDGSIYLAYATSSNPPGGQNFLLSTAANNANNPVFDPQKAKTWELGTKWDVLNKQLAVTAAVYKTIVENEVVTDSLTNVTAQIGKKRVQGVEVGVQGQITPVWDFSSGLAYMDTKVERGNATQNNATLSFTPRWSFTSWTSYRLPMGLTLGGGLRYEGSKLRSINNNQTLSGTQTGILKTPSYWVLDAMAAYDLSKNTTLQLNLFNVTDKDYIASVNGGGGRYIPGAPRSFLLSANFKF